MPDPTTPRTRICVMLLLLGSLVSGCSYPASGEQVDCSVQTLAALQSEYASARCDTDKRDVALLAVDRGAISPGRSIGRARELFGDDLEVGESFFDERRAMYYAIVHFAKPSPSPPDSAGGFKGWYMVIYLSGDRIDSFELKNTHK